MSKAQVPFGMADSRTPTSFFLYPSVLGAPDSGCCMGLNKENYLKPSLETMSFDMDCAFMSVSKVDLETESGNKSVTKDFDDINKQYIIY